MNKIKIDNSAETEEFFDFRHQIGLVVSPLGVQVMG